MPKRLSLLGGFGLILIGCSGDPAPTVGDAEIAKGIEYRETPKPTSPTAVRAAEEHAKRRPALR